MAATQRRTPAEIASDNARQAAALVEKAKARVTKAEAEVEKARPAVARAEKNLAYVLQHPDLPAEVRAEVDARMLPAVEAAVEPETEV